MQPDRVEQLERTVMAMVVQALTDYLEEAITIFHEETDGPQDIAEDIVREAIEAMGLSEIHERLYGKVDFKKAIYVFAPDAEPIALMLDAKAEKSSGSTATIQMSQTSMIVKMQRSGVAVAVPGGLEQVIKRRGRELLVVTVIAKFVYLENAGVRRLDRIIVACIPNGILQDRYNPDETDTIWRAGRDAPSLDEDFRVRVSYRDLREKAPWRVHEIDCPHGAD